MATFTETLAKIHAHASKELAKKKAASRTEQAKRKSTAERYKEDKILRNGLNAFAMIGLVAVVVAMMVF